MSEELRSKRFGASFTSVLLGLLALLAVACGRSNESPARNVSDAELPMPTGRGTQRALVLVEGDAPPPKKQATPRDAELSTPRIVQKVLGRP